jgi:hypothetical protein
MDLIKIGETKIGNLQDPFSKNCVVRVYVSYSMGRLSGEWSANGSVEFKNGNTNGEQTFDGKSFDEVVSKIKSFIETL